MSHDNHLKQQLDRSCDLMSSDLEQKLQARMNLAKTTSRSRNRRIGYTLAPVALAITVWFSVMNNANLNSDEQAIYDDLELLIAEGELDFLDDMDVSYWLDEQESIEEI